MKEYITTASWCSGVYCGRCGRKMYKDKDGNWRCPHCDDLVYIETEWVC